MPVFAQKDQTFVLALRVRNRADLAPEVQEIITKYGSEILGRFGIPSSDKQRGLIVLVMEDAEAVTRLAEELQEIVDLQVKTIAFD